MKKLAVLVMAGLMSVTASATNWVWASDSTRATVYVDVDSISNSSGYKTAFVKFHIKQYAEIISKGYDTTISFQQFNCRSNPKKYKILSARAISNNQTVGTSDASSNWSEAYPDSMGRDYTDFVCSH